MFDNLKNKFGMMADGGKMEARKGMMGKIKTSAMDMESLRKAKAPQMGKDSLPPEKKKSVLQSVLERMMGK